MNYKKLPKKEELHSLLTYNAQNGFLYWRKRNGNKAGCNARYVVVRVNKILYPAHRLIYKMVNGDFDESKEIDHINQDKYDNRIENLRVVTRQVNSMNRPKNKNNTSGYKGVTFCKQTNKWAAQIKVNYKNCKLGRYKKIPDAVMARRSAELQLP